VKELVFLVEEPSMRPVIDVIANLIIPKEIQFRVITHQGKSDLQKSIPRKMRAWTNPETWFIILHDKDSTNCRNLKSKLLDLCPPGKRDRTLIRIVCTELESWFLGDLEAVGKAFPKSKALRLKAKSNFRDPDSITNAYEELSKLVPGYQKVGGAREISPHLSTEKNTSVSFRFFLSGVNRILSEMLSP
jgi:Domain of unknown function (DUF4276)